MGLGKTLYNSSACLIEDTGEGADIEIALTERLLRKKASGAWPEKALRELEDRWNGRSLRLAENRDVLSVAEHEAALDRTFPLFEHLKNSGLAPFTRRFNSEIMTATHHLCHAMAAMLTSPFERCLIVVQDGAGSSFEDWLEAANPEEISAVHSKLDLGGETPAPGTHEECSVYFMEQGQLTCVAKRWRKFEPHPRRPKSALSESVGIFYENCSEYVFNSSRSSGKVMGLAPFGTPLKLNGRAEFIRSLDWARSFQGKNKREWQESPNQKLFADIAATAQQEFEKDYFLLLEEIRSAYPDVEHLILTGGCALNCTSNGKLVSQGVFREVHVPPFPGDECISLGAAALAYFREPGTTWKSMTHDRQHGYFGPKSSTPSPNEIESVFSEFEIIHPESITEYTAKELALGAVVGWFQGRSESGPRALGNRSILADPRVHGLKNTLNAKIKFREDFRPYGSSCLHEKAHEYFEVESGFNNPYMSFAVRTRTKFRELLAEVTHIDGTSRIQTVRHGQNPLFHELLRAFGSQTGMYCLLNTSMNVMGEPIVESVEDARRFFSATPIDGLAIGGYFIRRKGLSRTP